MRLVRDGGAFTVSLLPRTDRDVVRRFVKPVVDVERSPDGAVLAHVGPRRLRGRAGPASRARLRRGYLVLHPHAAPRNWGVTRLCIGEVVGVGGETVRGAPYGGHPHALRRLSRRDRASGWDRRPACPWAAGRCAGSRSRRPARPRRRRSWRSRRSLAGPAGGTVAAQAPRWAACRGCGRPPLVGGSGPPSLGDQRWARRSA